MKKYTFGTMMLAFAAVGLLTPSASAAPSDLEKDYGTKIDELIPGMAAEQIPARQDPQQKLERMCFEASKPGHEAERAALSTALIARCGPDTPMIARQWILRKLDPMGYDEVVDGLTKLLADEDKGIRELARRALANNPSPRAAQSLRDYLKAADCNKCRVAAINALAWRHDTESVPLIAGFLKHEDDSVVTAAVVALGKIGDDKAIAAVKELLHHIGDYPKQRNEIVEASLRSAEHLSSAGKGAEAAKIYDTLLEDINDQGIQIAAIHGLAAADPKNALAPLIALVEKGDSRIKLVAIRCVQDLEGQSVASRLIDALDDASPDTLAMLIDVLGRRGDKAALDAVVARVKDENEQVRVAALGALKTLGDHDTVMLLAERAAAAQGIERQTARDSLAGLNDRGVNPVIVGAIAGSTGAVRAELITAAAARRIAEAKPAIFKAAGDDDPAVRGAVIVALGVMGTQDDLPRLIDLLVQGISDDSRAAAEEAIANVCERNDDREKRVEPIIAAIPHGDSKSRASLVRLLGRLQGSSALAAIRAAARSNDSAVRLAAMDAIKGWGTTYIQSWVFSGACRQDNKGPQELFDIAFAPEKGESVDWQPLAPKARQSGRPFVFHLHKAAQGDNCAGYVKATIHAPADTKAVLAIGSDDGVKVWLNGDLVHANNTVRGLAPDQDHANVTLKKGDNVLMLKITQGGSDWSFCCGINASDGGPIDGLTFETK